MGDEWFTFVLLRRSMRVEIVNVGEIRVKPMGSALASMTLGLPKVRLYSSSVMVIGSVTSNKRCRHASKFGGFGTNFK